MEKKLDVAKTVTIKAATAHDTLETNNKLSSSGEPNDRSGVHIEVSVIDDPYSTKKINKANDGATAKAKSVSIKSMVQSTEGGANEDKPNKKKEKSKQRTAKEGKLKVKSKTEKAAAENPRKEKKDK